ncbi:MAG: PAS-domain containing protein, partial [Sneathiella sp.]|nr:PAS-domain containing protein [Sneathiella sp.]
MVISLTTAGASIFAIYDLIPDLYAPKMSMGQYGNVSAEHNHNNHFTHMYLGLMMGFGYFQSKFMSRFNQKNLRHIIILTSCILFLSTFLIQLLIQNTSNHHLSEIVSGVAIFTTLVILFVTFFCFLLRKQNGPQTIEFWLVFFVAVNFYLHTPSVDKLFVVLPLSTTQSGFYTIGMYLILLSGLIYNSLWIISLETTTRRNLTQQNKAIELLYTGALIISETDDFEKATSQCLERLAQYGEWDLAHVCFIDNNNDSFQHYWCGEKYEDCFDFIAITQRLGIEYGIGFSGKIWEDKKHYQIPNIRKAKEFLRKQHALEAGLNSAFGFPILFENKLVALLELYSCKENTVHEGFISAIGSLCQQLEILYIKEQRVTKLVKQERLLQELFDDFPAAMATFDANDHLAIYNRKFSKFDTLYGFDIHYGMEFSDWVTIAAYSGHMEDAYGKEQQWIDERLEAHKTGFRNQHRKLRNGRYVRVDEIKLKTAGTVCIWTDITEFKENERRSVALKDMLQTALTGFPGGICIFDAKMNIVMHNGALNELLNLSASEIEDGMTFNDFVDVFRQDQIRHNDFITQLSSLHAKIIKTKIAQSDPGVIVGKKMFMLHARPLKKGGFVLSVMDITEIQNYPKTTMSEQGLIDLSNKAKSELLETMSHDLRTPMNGILTAIDLLGDDDLKTSQVRHATTIKKSAHALMQVLNDNIEIMNIDTGHFTLNIEPVCIQELLHQLSNSC